MMRCSRATFRALFSCTLFSSNFYINSPLQVAADIVAVASKVDLLPRAACAISRQPLPFHSLLSLYIPLFSIASHVTNPLPGQICHSISGPPLSRSPAAADNPHRHHPRQAAGVTIYASQPQSGCYFTPRVAARAPSSHLSSPLASSGNGRGKQ